MYRLASVSQTPANLWSISVVVVVVFSCKNRCSSRHATQTGSIVVALILLCIMPLQREPMTWHSF